MINQILFWVKNPVGPDKVDYNKEVHLTCDDIYFKRVGTARMYLDGTLVGWNEQSPGEPRAPKVVGAREYTAVGPGDIVSIPRNMQHFMDPGSAKLGYVLIKVCD